MMQGPSGMRQSSDTREGVAEHVAQPLITLPDGSFANRSILPTSASREPAMSRSSFTGTRSPKTSFEHARDRAAPFAARVQVLNESQVDLPARSVKGTFGSRRTSTLAAATGVEALRSRPRRPLSRRPASRDVHEVREELQDVAVL